MTRCEYKISRNLKKPHINFIPNCFCESRLSRVRIFSRKIWKIPRLQKSWGTAHKHHGPTLRRGWFRVWEVYPQRYGDLIRSSRQGMTKIYRMAFLFFPVFLALLCTYKRAIDLSLPHRTSSLSITPYCIAHRLTAQMPHYPCM